MSLIKNAINSWHILINKHQYVVIFSEIAIVVLFAGITHFLLNKLIERFPAICSKYHKKPDQFLIDFVVKSIHKPLVALIWLMSSIISIELIYQKSMHSIKLFITILIITWLLLRILQEGEKYLINFVYKGDQKVFRQNKTTIIAVGRLLKIILAIWIFLIIMQALHIDITGLVAIGGAGTIVLGLAAKELLANFFGGMMIFMDRQFMVGDSIKSPNQDIEGAVEYIGWRLTRIRTLDGSLLYVPKSVFLTISVENCSKRYNRRIKEIIRLKYKDLEKINIIIADLSNMLKNHPDIDSNRICFVGINQFNYLAVDCLLWCFTKATDLEGYLKVQHDVLYQISTVLAKHEVEIVFTSSTLVDPHN